MATPTALASETPTLEATATYAPLPATATPLPTTTAEGSSSAQGMGVMGIPIPVVQPVSLDINATSHLAHGTSHFAPAHPAPSTSHSAQSTTTTITYAYDPLGRLVAADYDDGTYFHYAYDAVGNRLTQDTLEGSNTYAYDVANRLTSVDGVPYVWDANGNLLSNGVSTYAYDSANRLINLSSATSTSSYAYNGFGDRLQQTVDSISTNYTLDLNTGLTQVLAVGTNAYLYGRGRISQHTSHPAPNTSYFLADALGSVRQLSDATGAVSLAQSYAPYGDTLSSAGSGVSVWQYTGEARDVSGLTYLMARYLDSGKGRFISRDTWKGYFTRSLDAFAR